MRYRRPYRSGNANSDGHLLVGAARHCWWHVRRGDRSGASHGSSSRRQRALRVVLVVGRLQTHSPPRRLAAQADRPQLTSNKRKVGKVGKSERSGRSGKSGGSEGRARGAGGAGGANGATTCDTSFQPAASRLLAPMFSHLARAGACASVLVRAARTAQQTPVRPSAPPPAGPPPPTLPETITRDDQGRATVRAVRLTTPMRIDGKLDEAIYSTVQPASGFIQMEPQAGQPASERTEVWVFYDKDNVYVSFRAWESQPDRMIVNEMRRDSNNIRQGDSVEFALDTFRDRRNAILFEANALGGRTDLQSTNERQFNAGLESGLEPLGRTVRRRLDDRGGASLQVDPLRAWHDAGLGLPGATLEQVEERDRLPDEGAAVARSRPRRLLGVALRQPGRPRGAAALAQSRGEAVRDRRRDDRQQRDADADERSRRRLRRRREVQHHAEPDGRPHLQHRLRAGRGRRAAGEPHALQPVLPGETRLLPREPGAVHLRQQQLRRRRSPARPPTCRCSSTAGASGSEQPRGADLGRRPRHRPHRPLLARPGQHADARRTGRDSPRPPTSRSCA